MTEIRKSTIIMASQDTIWKIVSDPTRAPDWMPDVTGRQILTPLPVSLGTIWVENGLLRGRPYRIEYQLIEWNPPASMAYQHMASGNKKSYRWIERLEIEPAEGGCRVTATLDYQMPGGLFGTLYDRLLFRKDFDITLENRLEKLKELLEQKGEESA